MRRIIILMLVIFVGAYCIRPETIPEGVFKGVFNTPLQVAYAASGPVALWHLDESPAYHSTTIVDSSGYGNNGTLYTGDGTVNKATAGKVGGALSFDMVNDWVVISSLSSSISGDLTFSGWVKSTASHEYQTRILDLAQAGSSGVQLCMAPTGELGLENSGGPVSGVWSPTAKNDGFWHYMAATREGTTYKFYVDGGYIGTSGGTAPTYSRVSLGASIGGGGWYNGLIDEVAVYNRVLTQDEITEDYNNGIGIWPFASAANYTYETSKIEITGGVAKLRDLGGALKDDAILEYNSAFVAGDTTRGYSGTASGADVSLVLETASATLYKASGTFESRVFDTASGCGGWQRINANVVNGDIPNADSLFDSGLVSVWHMNGTAGAAITTGTIIPDATGQNNGTASNADTTGMAYASGKLNQAISFDGTNDYVNIGDKDSLNPHLNSMTIEVWVKTSDSDSQGRIYSKGTYGGTEQGYSLQLYPSSGGKVSAIFGTGHEHIVQSDTSITDGQWKHLAGVMNRAGSVELYVNNVKQASAVSISDHSAVDIIGVSNASIGVSYSGGLVEYFAGLIDEVSIWNRALDSAEVADHYNNGAGKELHRAAKFQVRSGSTVAGVSDSSFVGPLGNTTSYYTGANETLVSGGGFNTTHRYAQYKAYLNASTDSTRTPTVASVALVGTAGSVFDNTDGDFDLGVKFQVTKSPSHQVTSGNSFVGLSKMVNGGYNSYGTYTSHVIDGGASLNWDTLYFTLGGMEIDASENGLVGLWHFNGNWLDAKGTNNGVPTGATLSSLAKLGSACGSFGRTGSYVNCGGASSLRLTGDMTIEAWVKVTATVFPDGTTNWYITDSEAYLNYGICYRVDGDTKRPYFRTSQAGSCTDLWAINTIGKGIWYHLVIVRNGGTATHYLNGVANGSGAISDPVASVTNFYISDPSQSTDGLLDEVAIYNRALGASEVMNHYQNANPGIVKFQCRADSTTAGLSTKSFTGPDSTSATFYESTGSDLGFQFDAKRYLQYRMYLE